MASRKLRYIFWGELAALAAASILFVLPLKFGGHPLGLSAQRSVDIYYALSLVAIGAAQIGYMWPFRAFRVVNLKWFAGCTLLLLVCVWFWWSRAQGRRLDFSELENGEIFGTLVFALALPFMHGLAAIIGSAALDSAKLKGDQPNLPAR
jgi:hypothetical protein